jgi:hypothetical protein
MTRLKLTEFSDDECYFSAAWIDFRSSGAVESRAIRQALCCFQRQLNQPLPPLYVLSDMGSSYYVSFGVLEQMELQTLFGRESAARTFL